LRQLGKGEDETMNVRSITCFMQAGGPGTDDSALLDAGHLAGRVQAALEAAGYAVQSRRLATQPLSSLPGDPSALARTLGQGAAAAGFEYLSLGPVLAGGSGAALERLALLPDLIRADDSLFAGILVAGRDWGINLEAIRRAAAVVREVADTTDQGFGNLRLAVLANVGPHAPFFPAAYHDGGTPAVALALESAGLAVDAFSPAGSLDEAQRRLVAAVEEVAGRIVRAVEPLVRDAGFRFAGLDFSWAPFPEEARSVGAAVERLGVERFGAPGTLFAASLLTDCLRRARYPHCGFNGLMLPVLEDAVLAERSKEGLFTVNDLLLWSAVCGTGLDTVPLPGDVSEEELAGILLDVAALAVRLDKPLTARLMPVPGLKAGDVTAFQFAYFANGRVLDVKGAGSSRLFDRAG
jgi:uncharacterized protein